MKKRRNNEKTIGSLQCDNKLKWYNTPKGFCLEIYDNIDETWSVMIVTNPDALFELQKDINEQLDYRNSLPKKTYEDEW
jgi:hypothetical protein|tara:strand:+ start:620 stop:856 length:237 start_codon:yes stop_codon:yes gene_type:complete